MWNQKVKQSGSTRRRMTAGTSASAFIVVLALAALLFGALVPAQVASAQADPIRFGAVLVLSGDGAAYGKSQREGIELARDFVNAAGGVNGRPIEVLFEDSAGEQAGAVAAVQKLINRDRVLAIIGPTYSPEMFAAGPAANRARTPILGISVTAEGIGAIGEYVFRNSLPEAGVLPSVVRDSMEHFGYKSAALLYSNNNDFTLSAAQTFEHELRSRGVELVAIETFHDGDTDYRAQLTKVQAANPDVLIVSALYREAALLLQQARQMGLNQPVVGGNGFNSPELYNLAGDAVEGAIVGSPWFPGRPEAHVQEFVSEYIARYGDSPDQFAAQAFDGLMIFAEAARHGNAANDRQAFRDSLAAIRNFDGVTGIFSFDELGDPSMDANVLQIRGGKYELLND